MKREDNTAYNAVRMRWQRFWHYTRPIATWLLSIALVAVTVILVVTYVLSHYVSAVDADDPTPYEVEIPQNASASKIADLLYHACGEGEKGLIVSTASFKVYVDFVGKANSLKAGTYRLSKNMTIPEIVNVLAEGNPARKTQRFTVPEGYTVEEDEVLYEAKVTNYDQLYKQYQEAYDAAAEQLLTLESKNRGLRINQRDQAYADAYYALRDARHETVTRELEMDAQLSREKLTRTEEGYPEGASDDLIEMIDAWRSAVEAQKQAQQQAENQAQTEAQEK